MRQSAGILVLLVTALMLVSGVLLLDGAARVERAQQQITQLEAQVAALTEENARLRAAAPPPVPITQPSETRGAEALQQQKATGDGTERRETVQSTE